MQKNPQIKGVLLMLSCAAMWSLGGIFVKRIPWNPFVLGGWRGVFCVAVYLIFFAVTKRRFVFDRRSLLVGAASALSSFCFLAATKLTTAANAIVLQYTSPVFLMLLSTMFLKKRFRRKDYAVVVVTLAGIVLFFLDGISVGNMWGNLIAIFSGVVFACVYMFMGEAKDESARVSGMLVGALISAAVGVPLGFVQGTEITLSVMGLTALMAVFQFSIPNILYSAALNSCSPLACSLLSAAELLLNPLWVFLITGEKPGLWAFVGATVIIATITAWVASDAKYLSGREKA
ncbi:MAG TPA: DMT family transporter, partial [Clostridia bacterium]|nr:DMT family transporter [Clostridia bacterium]